MLKAMRKWRVEAGLLEKVEKALRETRSKVGEVEDMRVKFWMVRELRQDVC